MRVFCSIIVFAAGFILWSCDNSVSDKQSNEIVSDQISINDSLNKLDSLVNANKVSNKTLARQLGNRALMTALKTNSEETLAHAFLILGIAYSNQDSDSSFEYYSKALRISRKRNIGWIQPKALYNLAMIHLYASDQKTALILLDSTISVARRMHDFIMLSNAYNSMGSLMLDLMDTLESKKMFDSALIIARRNGLAKQIGVAIASLSRFEDDFSESDKMRKRAIYILKSQPGNEEEIGRILNNIGMRHTNPDSAIKYYQEAIRIAKSGNCIEIEITAYNNLAYSFLEKRKKSEAEICMENHAIPLALKANNYDWLSNLYDTYADVMMAQQHTDRAFNYERLSLQHRIKADQTQAMDQIRLLAALLNVKNKEIRIQSNERELESTKYKTAILYYILAIFVLLLIITVITFKWRIQRNKISFQRSLLDSAKKLIELEESMKGRIAMELHDLVSPFYTAMSQQIVSAKITDNTIESELKTNLTSMTERIRQISHRMNSNFIGQLSISELVNGLCVDLNSVTDVNIRCAIFPARIDLGSDQTIHVYRIIQELLTNAVKYATPKVIRLSISKESGIIAIFYEDFGPGFDVNFNKNKTLGISNIFERTKIMNGKVVLKSSLGSGTTWNIVIPVTEGIKR